MNRRYAIGVVAALLLASTTVGASPATASSTGPATPSVQIGDPRANILIGGIKLLLGRSTSTRVFRNVDELTVEINGRYDRYEAVAVASGNARVLKLLQEERAVLLGQLDAARQNAYRKFRAPEGRLLLSVIANTGPTSKLLGQASSDLTALAGQVNQLRTQIASGGGISLASVGQLATDIEQWTAVWSVVSGPSGRGLRTAAEQASATLRDVQAAGTAVDNDLAAVQNGLTLLSQTLDAVKVVPRRPRSGGVFGFITSLLGVDHTLIDAFREIFNPRLRNVPGLSRAELERQFDLAVTEMMRRRLANCVKRTGWELRKLADDPDSVSADTGRIQPALGPIDERLPMCQEPTTDQLVDLARSSVAVKPAISDPPVDRPTNGGTYTLEETSTSPWAPASLVTLDGGDLSVREVRTTSFVSLGGESIEPIDFSLTIDLAGATVTGSFSIDYACDPSTCVSGETTTGSINATFGPIPIGRVPSGVPDDFPFPEHHWYAPDADHWFAGTAVPIAVSLAGTMSSGEGGQYDTTVMGWFQIDLSPAGGYGPGELPEGWYASFGLRLDYPDTENPRWTMSSWGNAEIWDPNVARPPE